MAWLYPLSAILVGSLLSIQVVINSRLRTEIGHPISAALISFIVGGVALFLWAVVGRIPLWKENIIEQSPSWIWIGGFCGAVYVASATILGPRLGSALLLALVVLGQLMASLIIDHYALMNFPHHPMNAGRWVGAAMLAVGVFLIARN